MSITELVIEPTRTDAMDGGETDVRPLRLTVATEGAAAQAMRMVELTDDVAVVVAVIDRSQVSAVLRSEVVARSAVGDLYASQMAALGLTGAATAWARGGAVVEPAGVG